MKNAILVKSLGSSLAASITLNRSYLNALSRKTSVSRGSWSWAGEIFSTNKATGSFYSLEYFKQGSPFLSERADMNRSAMEATESSQNSSVHRQLTLLVASISSLEETNIASFSLRHSHAFNTLSVTSESSSQAGLSSLRRERANNWESRASELMQLFSEAL